MERAKKIAAGCSLVIAGIAIGISFDYAFLDKAPATSFKSLYLPDSEHAMISPLLLAGLSTPGDTQEFKNIESKLKLLTYDALNVRGVDTISIYYKDLTSGLWAGVGERVGYDPASLLKVPIMMAWLKKEQEHPGTLFQKLIWTGSPNDGQGIEFFGLRPGQSYTVDELIRTMITKSDNDSKNLLLSGLGPKDLDSVFSDLSIGDWRDSAGNPNKISPATYTRFLRVLYYSTYLSRDMSEKALELLSSSDFNDGLIAGVPPKTTVAHKFGQFTYPDPAGGLIDPIELHDCGIVYHPKKPYVLCVMTEGKTDIASLESLIANVSTAVYSEVDTQD